MKKTLSLILILLLLVSVLSGCADMQGTNEDKHYNIDSNYQDRVDFGAKLEPKGNYILHGAGQDQSGVTVTFDNYVGALGSELTPVVSMGYVSPHHHIFEWGEQFKKSMSKYDENEDFIMLQIGVHFNRDENPDEVYYDKIADGSMDMEVKSLINLLKSFNKPVYCRPGFEFNGEWNGYKDAETFKKAFRRFHDLVEECGAKNIALLWCMNPDAREKNFKKYYPGDKYVDWFAIDIFRIGSAFDEITKDFLRIAEEHKKPIMLTEVTPYRYDITKGQGWNEWFVRYFDFVRSNPVIKGTCYINWNWAEYPQWADWGDARFELADKDLLAKYRAEISDPIYLHAAPKKQITKLLYGYSG